MNSAIRILGLTLAATVTGCALPRHLSTPVAAHTESGRSMDPGPSGSETREPAEDDAALDEEALAKASQNPIADLISLPFQNNTNFDWGPENDTQNVLNIQPVVPFRLNDDWNVVTRTILPVISQPIPDGSNEFGLGDTTLTAWLSPSAAEGFVWGVGPVLLLPTSTDDALGVGEWGGGATAVGLWMGGPWVAGGLVSNVWSAESSAVNLFTLQPFVNYNLDGGWYLVTAPIVTSDWEASSDQRWTVPLGGGVGRVFKLGNQPVNMNVQLYDNVESPDFGAGWQLRVQLQLLFPKR